MNTRTAKRGDRFTTEDGKLWEVKMIFGAGDAGISTSAGPRVMLGLVSADTGEMIPNGYSVTVQHGAYRTPDEFTPVGQ